MGTAFLLALFLVILLGKPEVSKKFWVHAFQAGESLRLGLLDTITMSLEAVVVGGVVLALRHVLRSIAVETKRKSSS
eukprot:m.263438 g.263438  ORF g.263438 m.263438 type:complete len:77 (+) comp26922_c0_seq1:60-290(+)